MASKSVEPMGRFNRFTTGPSPLELFPSARFHFWRPLMLNTQPAEKFDFDPDGTLDIVKIWSTFQGEGPLAGTPAVFVRLAGCNLRCLHCDTNYTSSRRRYTYEQISEIVDDEAKKQGDNIDLVVLTGGEPLRQNIYPLCLELLANTYNVQVETNGTVKVPIVYTPVDRVLNHICVVCSPKTPTINQDLIPYIDAFKYVVSEYAISSLDGLPIEVLGLRYKEPIARPPTDFSRKDIYIQPEDTGDEEKNRRNLEVTKSVCMKFGYRLSLQTHKIIHAD